MRNPQLQQLEQVWGIHSPDTVGFIKNPMLQKSFAMAMDAQPQLVTVANTGIPAWLTTYIDPKLIEILLTPMMAAVILGEEKKGDWVTLQVTFPVIERTGEVSSYGDWNENGSTGANADFPYRQSYHYQTISQWGERQLAMAGEAKIDWAQQINIASAITLGKFQNKTYFFGVSGLLNYGLLNDPALIAGITPAAGVWSALDGAGVYTDIQRLFTQLQTQLRGTIKQDFKGVLVMSPEISTNMTKTNQYNVNVTDQIKKNFPNLRLETAVEYATTGGQLVQMIVDEVEGQKTATTAFTEKMRAHRIVFDMSSFRQKKSQGSWGTIIFMPVAIAQLLGV